MADTTPTTIASTVASLPGSAAERFGSHTAARFKRDGEWRELSYAEMGEAIDEIALGLIDLGIEVGDRVCILAETRLEWTLASLGVSAAGAVAVPVYPTNAPSECKWVAGNSGARAIFCENDGQRAKIEDVRDGLPDLEHVIGIDEGGGELSLDELRARGRERDRGELAPRQEQVSPEDAYTIVYTSGTTGAPKGVVLTHANAMAVCQMVEELEFVEPGDVSYLYLPLAHVFALITMLATVDEGTTLIYFGGNTREILAEIIETKPTYVPSVPRIFEKLYGAAMKMVASGSDEEQERFRKAVKLGVEVRMRRQRGDEVPAELAEQFEQADKEIFERVRGLFGGQVRQAVSGAAPIAPEILEFFYAAGVPVLEGWGMTETTGVGTVGTLDHFKFGTVGRALPGVEIKIAEDGEILCKGPHIFREYWRNPEATEETMSDGWLRTGDLGELDDEGYLKITGRKKDIIITAGGKNITPANLENGLKQNRWISQAVVVGDRRPFLVALITIDPEEAPAFAEQHGLKVEDLPESAEMRAEVQQVVDHVNSEVGPVEQIKKFKILPADLSQQTGELTPTLKVKRNVVTEKFGAEIDALYSR